MNQPNPAFITPMDKLAELGTAPVPARYYADPEWYELERQAIFMKTWIEIGHVCEIPEPGSFIVREVEFARASILITRGKHGRIRAFHNVCTHRGTQLTQEKEGRRSAFTCPYHGWTFNHDGELRGAPDFERFYVDKAACDLSRVSVDVCAGLIFINLDRQPEQGLRAYLGEDVASRLETLPVARATTFAEYVYDVEANWKITYDNFQEQYHIRFIHPRSGAAACGAENRFGYPVEFGFFGPHRTERIWSNPAPEITAMQGYALGMAGRLLAAEEMISEAERQNYFALFPNFFLLASPLTHFSHVVMPLSASRSRGVVRLYFSSEDKNASMRFAREFATRTAFDIHAEDILVIEAGQRGLNSGALDHVHFQSFEVLCRHLMHEVRSRVEAWQASLAEAGEGQ